MEIYVFTLLVESALEKQWYTLLRDCSDAKLFPLFKTLVYAYIPNPIAVLTEIAQNEGYEDGANGTAVEQALFLCYQNGRIYSPGGTELLFSNPSLVDSCVLEQSMEFAHQLPASDAEMSEVTCRAKHVFDMNWLTHNSEALPPLWENLLSEKERL